MSLDPEADDNGFSAIATFTAIISVAVILLVGNFWPTVAFWSIFTVIPIALGSGWFFSRQRPEVLERKQS
jgi:hypothetical protein